MSSCRRLTVCLLGLILAAGLEAQTAEPPKGPVYGQGWHTVRPGETLIGITRKYLGSALLWHANWDLNPGIQDPNVLTPGQRIRVLLEPRPVIPTARVNQLSGQVESRPSPIPWNAALEEELLLERDGLRTFEKSSTEMEFQDGTRILLTEESVVFLRRVGQTLQRVDRRSVEIIEGQADLEARLVPGTEVDVEIYIEGVRTAPKSDAEGNTQARARKAEAGGAQVMMYEGSGEIEAAGQKVEVARGMGSSVPQGAPPGPPEKLLPSPEGLRPEPGSELGYGNPIFSWEPVASAESYTLELCRDPGCALLVDRVTGLEGPEWRAHGLAKGSYHWRATAVSASGLDGYPSPGTALVILKEGPDADGPTGRLALSGAHVSVGSRDLYEPGVRVEAAIEDGGVGMGRWVPWIDGREASAADLEGPWPGGRHSVEARAWDRLGNESRIGPLEFEVDAAPPKIRWQVGGVELIRDGSRTEAEARRLEARLGRAAKRLRNVRLEEAAKRFHWEAEDGKRRIWHYSLAWATGTSSPADFAARLGTVDPFLQLDESLGVEDPAPEIVVLLPGLYSHVEIDRHDTAPGPLLRITASDAGAGVRSLTLRAHDTAAAERGIRTVFTIEAEDSFGNRSSADLRLVPAGPRAQARR